jgi:hypothetical protein
VHVRADLYVAEGESEEHANNSGDSAGNLWQLTASRFIVQHETRALIMDLELYTAGLL